MPISLPCPGCGRKLRAPDKLAGKTVACPHCAAKLTLPALEEEAAGYLLQDEPPAAAKPPEPEPATLMAPQPERPPKPRAWAKKKDPASLPPLKAGETPLWLRHLHWLLALALIPLAFSTLRKDEDGDFLQRVTE